MWESLQDLAEIRKQKRLVHERMEAAYLRLRKTPPWKDFQLYRRLLRHLEEAEAGAMRSVQAEAAEILYSTVKKSFPDEVDLPQDFARHVEIERNLGHLIKVKTNLN